jgi:hypothetical protein
VIEIVEPATASEKGPILGSFPQAKFGSFRGDGARRRS